MAVGKTSAKRVSRTQREAYSLSMRLQGLSYRAIADAYNKKESEARKAKGRKFKPISHETIRKDILRALETTRKKTADEAAYYRDMELQRLDMAQAAIAAQVRTGDVQAISTWVKICESRRKLLGLDAPVELKVEQLMEAKQDEFINVLEQSLDAETFAKVAAVAVAISEASAAAATN